MNAFTLSNGTSTNERYIQSSLERSREGADIRATNARDIPRADVWTFGAPCQDFSIAGKRAGMEGERSSLVLEVFRLVRETPEESRPKYLIYENVKGMLSSNGGRDFLGILDQMVTLGYDFIEYSLLNSKNFGVPQNRERVFVVGHLRGRSTGKVFPLTRGDGEITAKLKEITQGVSDALRVYDTDGDVLARTIKANGGGWGAKTGLYYVHTDKNKQTGERIAGWVDRDDRLFAYRDDKKRSTVQEHVYIKPGGKANTLTAAHVPRMINGNLIRTLAPKECWRLQGIADEITDKVMVAGISDTQMYRGAGDACTTNVIYEIAKKLT